jgi:hypothetical protein
MKQSEVALRPEYLQNADSFRSGKGKVVLSLLLFAVIPSIFMFVALQLTKVSGPQWLGSSQKINVSGAQEVCNRTRERFELLA